MKTAAICLILALFAFAVPAGALDLDEIQELHEEGLSSRTILAVIEASGQVFRLDTDEILSLKRAGVPEEVIRALIATALPAKERGHEAQVSEDGTVVITNRGADRAEPTSRNPEANVIPSRGYDSRPERTPVVLPETVHFAPQTVVTPLPPSTDRGPYGIGWEWHPSWREQHRVTPMPIGFSTGWPVGASIDVGYGSAAGYYFLPAAITPSGPSSFGQFGFHLLPNPALRGSKVRHGTSVYSGTYRHRVRP